MVFRDLDVTIHVNVRNHQMRMRRGRGVEENNSRRCRRRIVLAAGRALSADAALPWRIRQVPSGVRLDLRQSIATPLAARMCLPHLARLDELPLYRYQRHGVARLLRSRRLLLADDMGLGKTIQVADGMRRLVAQGRIRNALVVAPATLVQTWASEFRKWTPELVVGVAGPGNRISARDWPSMMKQCHVVVSNYESIRSTMANEGRLFVDLLAVDEAHRLKNWDSQTSRAVRRVDAEWVWALTGTPLERDSEDLASILAFLDRDGFTRSDASLPLGILRAKAGRIVLRREKGQVLADLPPVTRIHEKLAMGKEQARAYKRACEFRRGDNTLAQFNKLRTVCDYDPMTGDSSKIDRIVAILQQVAKDGEKAVVFSYILKPLDLLLSRLRQLGIKAAIIVGSMSTAERRKTIAEFREGDVQVLLASMRIASEGLTLVEANHVLFVNRWWNPSLNQQATDRVVRIGQHRRVFVYAFTLVNTIEEDLDRLLGAKVRLFDTLIGRLRSSRAGVTGTLSVLRDRDG